MKRFARTWAPALLAIIFICLAHAAWAQEVRFIRPSDGDTVRGVVTIQVRVIGARPTWVSYLIAKPGQEGKYLAAVAAPYVFQWDTSQRDEKGKRVWPDGEYVITAAAYTASRPGGTPQVKEIAKASIRVKVANEQSASEVDEPILLRVEYRAGERLGYQARVKAHMELAEGEKKRLEKIGGYLPLQMDVILVSDWDEIVLEGTRDDEPATVDKLVLAAYGHIIGSQSFNLPVAGRRVRMLVFPNGVVKLYRENDKPFALGQYFVPLPDHPVKAGDSQLGAWSGVISVLPLPIATNAQRVPAQHKLDGYEWRAGQLCARIVSTFGQRRAKPVMVKLGPYSFPLKTKYKATRTSYLSLRQRRFVAFEERIEHVCEVPYQVYQAAWQLQYPQAQAATATMGMGGGAAGMGMGPGGPMMPGAAMPLAGAGAAMMGAASGLPTGMPRFGAAAEAGAMGPGTAGYPAAMGMPGMLGMGGMPGMPGMGGMMGGQAAQQQAKPVKLKITVSLSIRPRRAKKS